MVENEQQETEQEDAITQLAIKSEEIFGKLYKKLICDGFSPETAKEVALALTPRPIELLSAIYAQGFNEDDLLADEDMLIPDEGVEGTAENPDEVPDDDVLKQYKKEGSDGGKGPDY